MRQLFGVVSLVALLAFAFTGCSHVATPVDETEKQEPGEDAPRPEVQFVVVSSAGPGSLHSLLGGGVANIISDKVPGVFAQLRVTASPTATLRLVGCGESEMGMAIGNAAFDAYMGTGAFAGCKQPLRALFSVYPSPQHIVVLDKSPIQSIEGLVGKRASVDVPGSSCEVISRIILEAAGIMGQVDMVNYSREEAAEALKDGIVDAVFYNFAYPAAVVEEISATHAIRLIPIEDALLDEIVRDYPYFTKGDIPGKTYRKVPRDTRTLMVSSVMVCHEGMEPDLAYGIVKALYDEESLKYLAGIHPVAVQCSPGVGVNTPIPLHPGAEVYFKETGILP